ncbi:SGNH/GDSL hydrolase family protein [Microbacterium sp. ZXX196]|uniref:SGNH/GDSL hydrolase family protein n=1 Tax=Microbacterium sp. ZXX196 TaxID=2609291 RepID=UPI0012B821B5|nr:SGNH/GDSL hydrolase family protein [Microbacterium sp. ZXX196]MTE23639.1 SGNH/GDSL hydrolase family protein [Microbacterium sp. ZXX196]
MSTDPRTPFVGNAEPHPWRRFVAVGDSFTEGIGDPEPGAPGGHRGWADRVAEVLSRQVDDFAYANLAVRGKLIRQIRDDQIDAALALQPDLVTICAGGNDVLRPGTDPDEIAAILETLVRRLGAEGAAVVVFPGFDVGWNPVFRAFRGKIAIYNENIRRIAEENDALVADLWALREIQDPRFWSDDRLHLNPLGHHEVARMVLRSLNAESDLQPLRPDPLPPRTWRAARREDLVWARAHLVPWVLRRLRHQSSGDGLAPKRPDAAPYAGPDNGA